MPISIKTLSNLLFAVPLFMAVFFRLYYMIFFIGFVLIISSIYHIYDEKMLSWLDTAAAFALIGSNLVLVYLSRFKSPYFYMAMVFVAISFFFYFGQNSDNYSTYHSLWHISSVIITIFCILGYVHR